MHRTNTCTRLGWCHVTSLSQQPRCKPSDLGDQTSLTSNGFMLTRKFHSRCAVSDMHPFPLMSVPTCTRSLCMSFHTCSVSVQKNQKRERIFTCYAWRTESPRSSVGVNKKHGEDKHTCLTQKKTDYQKKTKLLLNLTAIQIGHGSSTLAKET